MTGPKLPDPLALFALRTVLFPGAMLGLTVFEARYLDLASECLRSGQPFGVVCLRQGAEAGPSPQAPEMESVGTLCSIDEVDAAAFRAQADMLLENTETVARVKQRSLVSLETAQHVQTQLISAFDKLEQISKEGQQRRKDELPKLQELERELVARFSPAP